MTNDFLNPAPAPPKPRADNAAWQAIVLKYQKPSTIRALWQIIDTIIPFALAWYLMYRCRSISLWLVVPLAVLAGGLLVRVFIIFLMIAATAPSSNPAPPTIWWASSRAF